MSLKEFFLAFVDNSHTIFLATSILSTLITTLFSILYLVTLEENPKNVMVLVLKRIAKVSMVVMIFSWLGFCIPSTGDLWRVHVDLMKLDLANSENIKLGIDKIDLIGREIETECKKGDTK